MTPAQIKMIHVAANQAGMNRAQYELMLVNIGGVESCKQLTNETFEDCMAYLEDCGVPGTYWRDKVQQRASQANPRMVHKVHALFAEYQALQTDDPAITHYELAGLVGRASKQRTRSVEQLLPKEAWGLIETLKALVERAHQPRSGAEPKGHEETTSDLGLEGEIPF